MSIQPLKKSEKLLTDSCNSLGVAMSNLMPPQSGKVSISHDINLLFVKQAGYRSTLDQMMPQEVILLVRGVL